MDICTSGGMLFSWNKNNNHIDLFDWVLQSYISFPTIASWLFNPSGYNMWRSRKNYLGGGGVQGIILFSWEGGGGKAYAYFLEINYVNLIN